MAMVKAVPVASFIILALVWLDAETLSLFISAVYRRQEQPLEDRRHCRWAAVFQEGRLLEDLSAVANLRFALGEIPGEAGGLLGACTGFPSPFSRISSRHRARLSQPPCV